MKNALAHLLGRENHEDGASSVEYGILVGAVAAVVILVIFAMGGIVKDVFKNTCDDIDSRTTTTTTCSS